MKKTFFSVVISMGLALAATCAYAAGKGDTGSMAFQSTNRAIPALPSLGQGTAATPAMPGNPTAQQMVTENRQKEQALRDAAEARAAAAQSNANNGNGMEQPMFSEQSGMGRPDNERPQRLH